MKKYTTVILALLCCLLWAIVFPILKLLYLELGINDNSAKLTLAGMRFLMAGVLVLLYYVYNYKKLPKIPSMQLFRQFGILGLFQTTLLYAFFFIGTSNTSGIKSSVLSQSSIFFVAILAHIFLRDEKINLKKGVALLLGILGMLVININHLESYSDLMSFSLTGEGYLLISGLFSAIGTIIAKKMGSSCNTILMNGWQMTMGGGVLIIIGLYTYGRLIHFPNSYSFILFLILILISAVAFTLWFNLLKYVKASEITVFKFTIPIIGSLSSAIIIPGESLSVYVLIGLALVSSGIYYCNAR